MDSIMGTSARISSASAASTSYRLRGSDLWPNKTEGASCPSPTKCLFARRRAARSMLKPVKVNASLQGATKVDDMKINGTKVDSSKLNGTGDAKYAMLKEASDAQGALPDLPSKGPPTFNAVLAAVATILVASQKRQHLSQITGKTQFPVDSLKQGRLVEGRLVYRQTFVVRSYEVGADRTASIETLMNHFQETALNHVWMSGLAGHGFGATRAMVRHNLIWVVTRMHAQVDGYPAWGDAVEIDTWVAASGKNGMRRDWLVRDYKSGQILARATSTWVVMNQKTRRLSKMPDDVRDEIRPFYLDRCAIVNDISQKITKLDDSAQFVSSGLMPRHADFDMNQHVNNVKYIGWMMESVPSAVVEEREVQSMTLEYRQECGQNDIVQSMTSAEHLLQENGSSMDCKKGSNACSSPSSGAASSSQPLCLTHLLRMQKNGSEIVRGRTVWRAKNRVSE